MGAVVDGTRHGRQRQGTRSRGPPPFRRYPSSVLLLLFYIPIVVVPWVATCILTSRPMIFNGATYDKTEGRLSPGDLEAVRRWMTAIRALNTAAAVFTVPIVSAILAHAAVVVAQRKSAAQKLNLRELLSLADGSWARVTTNYAAKFTIFGLAFIIFSIALPLLQSVLVTPEEIRVVSCLDVPSREFNGAGCEANRGSTFRVAGYDPEPADIERLPQDLVVGRVADRVIRETDMVQKPNIWLEGPRATDSLSPTTDSRGTLSRYFAGATKGSSSFFISSLLADINTGILRGHAMRLNSTIQCDSIGADEFPSTCSGNRPFQGSYDSGKGTVRFCVPGASDATPWTISRNRQDITEELYISSSISAAGPLVNNTRANFSARCVAKTTRGYFELPNTANKGNQGPLLASWPSAAALRDGGFSDLLAGGRKVPSESDSPDPETVSTGFRPAPSPFNTSDQRSPGPLMTTLLAALGNGSFFDLVQSAEGAAAAGTNSVSTLTAICARGLPFSRLHPAASAAARECDNLPASLEAEAAETATSLDQAARERMSRIVTSWFTALNPVSSGGGSGGTDDEDAAAAARDSVHALLGAGMYHANEALLAEAASGGVARRVYAAAGTPVTRPRVGPVAMAVVSALLGAQVVVLLALAGFAYRAATPAARLDGAAMLIAGARLRDDVLARLDDGAADNGDQEEEEGAAAGHKCGVALDGGDVDASDALRVDPRRKDEEDRDEYASLAEAERARMVMAMTPPPMLGLRPGIIGSRESFDSSLTALVAGVPASSSPSRSGYASPSPSGRGSASPSPLGFRGGSHRYSQQSQPPSHSRAASGSYDAGLSRGHESPTQYGFHLPRVHQDGGGNMAGRSSRASSRSRLGLNATGQAAAPAGAGRGSGCRGGEGEERMRRERVEEEEHTGESAVAAMSAMSPTEPVSPLSDDGIQRRFYGIAS